MGIESIYLQYTYDERTKGRRKEFYICIKGAKKKKISTTFWDVARTASLSQFHWLFRGKQDTEGKLENIEHLVRIN